MELKIYCDGGSRGNPGPAACAFIIYGESAGSMRELSAESGLPRVIARGKYLGETTNNIAEYSAVIEALTWLASHPELRAGSHLTFFLDSQLVVSQLNGLYKVKNSQLRELLVRIRALETGLTVAYSYIPRSQNASADALVNATLDRPR